MSVNESSGERTTQTVEVIGFVRRLAAYLLDAVVLGIIQFTLLFCAGSSIAAGGTAGEDASGFGVLLNCLSPLIAVGYFVVFWVTSGQTPGKMVTDIKVISVDGAPVSWGKAIVRYIGYIISGLVLSLGFIWVVFDAERQGWHDKIAGTYVVRKDTHFSSRDAVTFVPADQGRSAVVVVLLALFIFVLPVCVIATLALLGGAVSDVFSNITDSLATPQR